MHPSSSPYVSGTPASFGIDEATLRELREMETFSSREPMSAVDAHLAPTVNEGFFDAYIEELRGRTRPDAPYVPPSALAPAAMPAWGNEPTPTLYPPAGAVPQTTLPPITDSMELSLDFLDQELPLEGFTFDAHPATAAVSVASDEASGESKKKKRLRTPQQQEMNKLAQQRYRERRKQKHSELETEVERLRAKVNSYEQVESRNVELVRRNKFLEKMVGLQQEEVRVLKAQIFSQFKGVGDTESSETISGPKSSDTLRQELDTQVRALKQFLEANQVEKGDDQIPEQSRQLVSKIVSVACEATARLTSLAAGELVDRDIHEIKKQHVEHLLPCIQSMNLNEKQTTAIMDMRADHLTRMRRLYTARQKLNMKAMALMLPHPSHHKGGPLDRSVSGKMDCITNGGFADCNKAEQMLNTLLDEIKENLHAEQASYMELQVSLLQCILNPVQSAQLLVHWHPDFLDALAFANTLSMSKGGVLNLDALGSAELEGGRSPHKPVE
ncbi:hypothetical protein BSKO_03939 [Bryopsis sp. KO-2023]|nr:hypothetical protein BSKO_03939 [Bryopsis sp. KO-2023]